MFYFNFKDFQILGSSPEILVRLIDDVVTIRPIAGTRPRGKNQIQDNMFTKELLNDPKELAEHFDAFRSWVEMMLEKFLK